MTTEVGREGPSNRGMKVGAKRRGSDKRELGQRGKQGEKFRKVKEREEQQRREGRAARWEGL